MKNNKILGLLLAGVMVTSIPFNVFADNQSAGATSDQANPTVQTGGQSGTQGGGGSGTQSQTDTNTTKFTVTFKNGEETLKTIEVNNNEVVKESEKPSKPNLDGYTISGWYIDKELNTPFDPNKKITENTELYAKLEETEEHKAEQREIYRKSTNFDITSNEYSNGKFTGKVRDLNGYSVGDATVEIYVNGSYWDRVYTNSNGDYSFDLRDSKYYGKNYWYDWETYQGKKVYTDLDGRPYYKLSNGSKEYLDNYYGRIYKVEIKVSKTGFNDATKTLVGSGYYGRDWWYNRYDARVYPTDISRTNYSASGYLKGYKTRTVYVYDDGTYLGSSKIDSDGYFNVSWNSPYVSTSRSLEYYVNGTSTSNSTYSMIPVVNALSAGASFVRGNVGPYADVTVYDANGVRLGGTTAGSTGIYNISLNRALVAGETIKVEAKESGKTSRSTEVKIAGQEAKATAEVNQPSYIAGYPDGTFKPGKEVTRAEAVRMFVRLVNEGKELPKNPTTKFKDANNNWYSDEINFAVSKGFIKGYSDGTFKPNQGITRAEFAQMIAVFVKDGYPGSSNFKDVKGHWASNAIEQLYGSKKIKGYSDGTFKPDQKLTRAEAVTVLNSVFGRNTKATSFANVNANSLKKFSDVPMSHWAYYEIIDASNGHNAVKGDKAEDVSVWQ
ncbi:S-layer homology domain-containing protein [Peptoniphilus sp. DNF00840]|uniref:S-layer homology domain-containing protein n=1 Tax=Peptoniphilus sp. DNF00840 TaxID=1477000 RepID=UPI0007859648|nr:S-layer homology domain-containing protein [Peptoniphilus sp. DNF00840]KXB72111.1 hypothetical protein HMPREF1864_00225 [Peptoniphilus sp. DNF00840]